MKSKMGVELTKVGEIINVSLQCLWSSTKTGMKKI